MVPVPLHRNSASLRPIAARLLLHMFQDHNRVALQLPRMLPAVSGALSLWRHRLHPGVFFF